MSEQENKTDSNKLPDTFIEMWNAEGEHYRITEPYTTETVLQPNGSYLVTIKGEGVNKVK